MKRIVAIAASLLVLTLGCGSDGEPKRQPAPQKQPELQFRLSDLYLEGDEDTTLEAEVELPDGLEVSKLNFILTQSPHG